MRLAELTSCGICVILVGNPYWSVYRAKCAGIVCKWLQKHFQRRHEKLDEWGDFFCRKLADIHCFLQENKQRSARHWFPSAWSSIYFLSSLGSGSSLYCVNLTLHSLWPGQHLYKVLISSVFGYLYVTNSSWSWQMSAQLVHFPASMYSIPLVYRNITLDMPWHKVPFSLLCMHFGAEFMNCCYSSDRSSYL